MENLKDALEKEIGPISEKEFNFAVERIEENCDKLRLEYAYTETVKDYMSTYIDIFRQREANSFESRR